MPLVTLYQKVRFSTSSEECMRNLVSDNFDGLFAQVVHEIYKYPEYECKPRGQVVKELIAPNLELLDPRARLLACPHRAADYGFGVGEFFWYWLGKQDVESMLYYNKRMGQFSDDGFTLNSAYGHRTRNQRFVCPGSTGQLYASQWDAVKKTLLEDVDSRRAILIIGKAEDYTVGAYQPSKDLPCTLSLQFFIRNNKLHLHTNMRSNDAFWGLTYDLFSFTLLQECMMLELQEAGMTALELGFYSHTAGSLHIYDRHFAQASAIAETYLSQGATIAEPMAPISLKELALLADQEEALRTGKVAEIGTTQFSSGVRWMAEQLNAHRRKRDGERSRSVGPGNSVGNQVVG
jgi:thymidylate synthase